MLDVDRAREIVASYAPPFGQVQIAMRKALDVTSVPKPRRRRRRSRGRGHRRRDLDECRRQRTGVDASAQL